MATISPIKMFDSAHARADGFLTRGLGAKGKDDLRAAVVFAVAAIDAFFRAKVTDYFRKNRLSDNKSKIPELAQKLIREEIAKKNFNKEYQNLTNDKKQIVNTTCESNKQFLIKYLEQALKSESFQGIDKIDKAFRMMDKKPQEIWGKFDSSAKVSEHLAIEKQKKKNKAGRKIDTKTQLGRMFLRRHIIVHEADLVLTGRKNVGGERKIEHAAVKKWLDSSKKQ